MFLVDCIFTHLLAWKILALLLLFKWLADRIFTNKEKVRFFRRCKLPRELRRYLTICWFDALWEHFWRHGGSILGRKSAFLSLVLASIIANGLFFPHFNVFFWIWGAYLALFSLAVQKFRSYKDDIVDQANTLLMQLNDTKRLQPLSQVAYVQHLPCPPKPEFENPISLWQCLTFRVPQVKHWSEMPPEVHHPETVQRLKRAVEGRKKHLSLKEGLLGAKEHRGAVLPHARLEEADLSKAHLQGAILQYAHLQEANLLGAHLERANLFGAHLQGADFLEAHLERAKLFGAHLEGANLEEAHLEGAKLWWAHLEGANLTAAHLERAQLTQAHLQGADLEEAHLQGAESLTVEQLIQAKTLYQAQLDPELKRELRDKYPDDAKRLLDTPPED